MGGGGGRYPVISGNWGGETPFTARLEGKPGRGKPEGRGKGTGKGKDKGSGAGTGSTYANPGRPQSIQPTERDRQSTGNIAEYCRKPNSVERSEAGTFLAVFCVVQPWPFPPTPFIVFYDASTSSTWIRKTQKYVTVTLEKKFPPCLVGGARTQEGPRRKRKEN